MRPRIPSLLLPLLAGAAALSGCGGESTTAADAPARSLSPAQANPAAPPLAGLLGRIAASGDTSTRIGAVDVQALRRTALPVSAETAEELVLGEVGARRLDQVEGASVAAQIGGATVIEDADGARTVDGGAEALRASLEDPAPATGASADTTQDIVQHCLSDAVAQVVLGPGSLGRSSALGAGLVPDAEAVGGPALRLCVAPNYIRQLHEIEEQLEERWTPRGGVVVEDEVSHREMLIVSIPVDRIDAGELRSLLSGGAALRALLPAA